MRLEHPAATAETALALLTRLPAQRLGEAVHGIAGAGPPSAACQPAFIAGFSERLARLAEEEFILALPDLRAAMARAAAPRTWARWPARCSINYHMTMLPTHALQAPVSCSPQRLIHHQLLEQQALAALRHWGGR